MNRLARASAAILAIASALPLSAPAQAQQAAPSPNTAVCMARTGNNPDSPTFVALVPVSEQPSMADKGYAAHVCLIDAEGLAAYRTKVCHLANDAPALVQSQFEQEYNVTPRALCDMADALMAAQ